MKRLTTIILLLYLVMSSRGEDTTKPWTFWYWMYGAVSEEGIRADLQGMKDVGLGGCYLMPIRGHQERPEFQGDAQQLSPTFWKRIDYALAQADSLGLEMGIHICDGFALAGGPWIRPEESMQKIVFCDTIVRGGHHRFTMPKPIHDDNYYEDIALFAVPVAEHTTTIQPTTDFPRDAKGVMRSDVPCHIVYDFGKPTLVSSIEIEPSGNNIQSQRLLVEASADGFIYNKVKQLTPPRQGWQNTDFLTTFSIPPTNARYFRFYWTPEGTEPGSEDLDAAKWKAVLRLKNIRFHHFPLIDNWEGKAGYVWRIAPETAAADIPQDQYIAPADILHLKVSDRIDVTLPEGTWRLLRMGHTSTGHTNATAGGAKGLECDKFSKEAVSKQVDAWFGRFLQRPHHEVIKYMHVDSWECGSQNWSRHFAEAFRQRRGYDLLPFLPVYAGVPLQGAEKVLRDIRITINDLLNEVFFATVAEKAHHYGVRLSSESVAPTMVSDGMDHYRYVDMPMGEYWLNSPTHDKPNDMLDAISGAHVYGKNIVQAEGFTEVRGVWDETPAMVKPLLDRQFAMGMNRLFFHVNTHNPWLDKKPGMTLDGIGLFFQRDQTWYKESKAFVDYITRCQRLLQQGLPVTDIAVFVGEEMPCRALTPDRLVSMLPGLFGEARIKSEQQRLANVGQPMEESPVGVRHSTGIIDMKDWVNALHGYQYDSMNKDALLTQPFHYRALVVPQGILLSQEVKQKIAQLRQRGVIIIDQPYPHAQLEGVRPDVILPEGIAYCHRKTQEKDIYFLSNQQDQAVSFKPLFRDQKTEAVVYLPQSDNYISFADGTLSLAPYESCFVIFGTHAQPVQERPVFSQQQPLDIKTWDLHFLESGITLKQQPLFDWSQHSDDRIHYFSGHVRYTATFKYRQKVKGHVILAFPHVRDIARIWVNGKDCGTVWTAPYEVDITPALKKGKNDLVIEVVNTWHNALRGMDQSKAPYEGIWTNAKYRSKGNDLLPAGLLAPPELKIAK